MFLKGNAKKGKTDNLMDDVSFAKPQNVFWKSQAFTTSFCVAHRRERYEAESDFISTWYT